MTIYKHTTKDLTAKLIKTTEDNNVIIHIDHGNGTIEEKITTSLSFKRWWAPQEVVEEVTTEEPNAVEPVKTEEPNAVEPVKTEEPNAVEPVKTEEPKDVEYTPLSEVAARLENLFDVLNVLYFENALTKPVITIQSTPKAYGHCSTKKVWQADTKNSYYEINIGAEHLNRTTEQAAATLLHEMVHLFCRENDINETSQKGRYHNKTFKLEAEARDLEIGYRYDIGYSLTTPTEALIDNLKTAGVELLEPFAKLARATKVKESKLNPQREKAHAYVCPVCGQTVRTTAELALICGNCNEEMTRED